MGAEDRTDQLERELRKLKRGAGLAAAELGGAVGPLLRQACAVSPADGTELLRSRLSELVRRHARPLPESEQKALLAALGLHPDAKDRFLKERLRRVLKDLDRYSERTADRLANRGIRLVAQGIAPGLADRLANPYLPTGFYTESLETTVRLDLSSPEWRELRRVVSTRDGLTELAVGSTVPRLPDPDRAQIDLEVVAGGRLLSWSRTKPAFYSGAIALPRSLDAGERHEYEVLYRASPPDWIQPHYLLTPHLRCDRLTVRVRFGSDRRSTTAWRLDGVPRGAVDDPPGLAAPVLVPDAEGWVAAGFEDLHAGLSYGVRWDSGRSAD